MLEYRFPQGQQLAYDISNTTRRFPRSWDNHWEVNTVGAMSFTVSQREWLTTSIPPESPLILRFDHQSSAGRTQSRYGRRHREELHDAAFPFGKELGMQGNEEIQYTLGLLESAVRLFLLRGVSPIFRGNR